MIDTEALARELSHSCFYGAKTETIDRVEVLHSSPLTGAEADTSALIVRVHHGQSADLYQLYVDSAGRDVLGERASDYGAALAAGRPPVGEVHGDAGLIAGLSGRPLGLEQSNSTLVFGAAGGPPQVAVKVFRKLEPGLNPEVELLTQISECPYVPRIFAWVGTRDGADPVTLAIAEEFIADSANGWADALEFAAADRSFAPRATALGKAVRAVHEELADKLGTEEASGEELVGRLDERLAAAAPAVESAAGAELFARARTRLRGLVSAANTQRIHGDLHLGQVLVVGDGYRILDFEGEPARPLAERRRRDPAVRDVAGLVRSIDYAAHFPAYSHTGPGPKDPSAWSCEASEALLAGYGLAEDQRQLLDAYVLDKALYEVAYEANNRPDWVGIPLAAVRRLLGDSEDSAK
ncbi:phosphotransferase [Corynebacterium atypicum]|uniref:phosphotransferase n=1 Tax=Corynebacterium atypicum TaxID=191610 RepID=UPI000B07EE82|nr:phosphotransferase [Corynebacterium atypicum]